LNVGVDRLVIDRREVDGVRFGGVDVRLLGRGVTGGVLGVDPLEHRDAGGHGQ
jgi:hypothetical protein